MYGGVNSSAISSVSCVESPVFLMKPVLIAIAAAIFILAVMPSVALGLPNTGGLHLHIIAFSALTGAAFLCWAARAARLWAAGTLMLFGVAIEAVQYLLPWRDARWLDLGINAVGIGLGAMIYLAVEWFVLHRRRAAIERPRPRP
jgi:hypothetical protein